MSSDELSEFNENFNLIKKIYEESIELLSIGIDLETSDEEAVSKFLSLK